MNDILSQASAEVQKNTARSDFLKEFRREKVRLGIDGNQTALNELYLKYTEIMEDISGSPAMVAIANILFTRRVITEKRFKELGIPWWQDPNRDEYKVRLEEYKAGERVSDQVQEFFFDKGFERMNPIPSVNKSALFVSENETPLVPTGFILTPPEKVECSEEFFEKLEKESLCKEELKPKQKVPDCDTSVEPESIQNPPEVFPSCDGPKESPKEEPEDPVSVLKPSGCDTSPEPSDLQEIQRRVPKPFSGVCGTDLKPGVLAVSTLGDTLIAKGTKEFYTTDIKWEIIPPGEDAPKEKLSVLNQEHTSTSTKEPAAVPTRKQSRCNGTVRLLFFDFETNGFRNCSILSATAMRVQFQSGAFILGDVFNRFYFPEEKYNTEAIKVNGLNSAEITSRRDTARYPKHFTNDGEWESYCSWGDLFVAHNIAFDKQFLGFTPKSELCTMKTNTPIVRIKKSGTNKFKWPKLLETVEFYKIPVKEELLHFGFYDTHLCMEVFRKMYQDGHKGVLRALGQ